MTRNLWLELIAACAALVAIGHGTALAQPAPSPAGEPPMREVQVAAGTFSRGDRLPDWVDPAPIGPTELRRPVVIRLADTQFLAGDKPVVFVSRAIQVNDAARLGAVGQFPIFFVPDYQRLTLHTVRILRGSESADKTATVNVRFLNRESGLEQGVYSGVLTAVVLVDDLRVGDTLHVVYSIEGANPVFGGSYGEFANWDQADPIELRRVTLNRPAGRAIAWRMLGDHRDASARPSESTVNGMSRVRFEERSIPGLDFEPYIPADYFPARYIQFSESPSWNAVAAWAAALYDAPATLPADLESLVQRLRALPDDDARVSAALQWVQSEIRYFSVSLGESSHRPHSPSMVLQRRYGDCKDKTFLLITILRALGLRVEPALVSTRTPKGPSRSLPSALAFDHVVVRVRVGSATHFLDPTRLGQRGKLHRMGQALEGSDVLIAAADTQGLTRIETPGHAALVRSELEEKIVVPSLSGAGRLESRQNHVGVRAEVLRVALAQLDAEQRRNAIVQPYERRYPGISIVGDPQIEDDPENNVISVRARFNVPNMSVENRGNWLVRYQPRNFVGTFAFPEALTRKFPLVVPAHPYEARYSLEIEWPEAVSVIQDPTTRRVNGKHFDIEVTRSFRGNRSRMDIAMRTLSPAVAAADVQRLMEDVKRMDQLVPGFVMIEKSDIKSGGLFGIGRKSMQDTMRERLEEVIQQVTQAVAGGRLEGRDLAEALCSRGEALADLGRPAEGLKDADEAVKAAPAYSGAYSCRGNVLFVAGEFARSQSDYTRALTLGESASRAFYRRGHARYYLGNLVEAAEDFAKGGAATTDTSERVYIDLWLAWTLRQLGKPLPADLAQRARSDARGAWPRSALAMLAGELSADEVLADVNRKQGDDRALALAEAWFYIGQHHLLAKQAGAAREAFEKAIAQGVTMYIEHVSSGFELRRLGAQAGGVK